MHRISDGFIRWPWSSDRRRTCDLKTEGKHSKHHGEIIGLICISNDYTVRVNISKMVPYGTDRMIFDIHFFLVVKRDILASNVFAVAMDGEFAQVVVRPSVHCCILSLFMSVESPNIILISLKFLMAMLYYWLCLYTTKHSVYSWVNTALTVPLRP